MTSDEARKYIETDPMNPERWREVGKARGWGVSVSSGIPAVAVDLAQRMRDIPYGAEYHASRYDSDYVHTLHLWDDKGNSYDIFVPKDADREEVTPMWKEQARAHFETKLSGGDTQTYWQKLP